MSPEEFVAWIDNARSELSGKEDSKIGFSGNVEMPVAGPAGSGERSRVVTLGPASRQFEIKAEFFRLLDESCPRKFVENLHRQYPISASSTVRELLWMMAECRDQISGEKTAEYVPSDSEETTTRSSSESQKEWPPDDGWHFRSGEFAFGGKAHALSGVRYRILEAFVRARRNVTVDDLRKEIWPESFPENSTIRSHVSTLRRELRQLIGLSSSVDPIPHVDTGAHLAWKLDDSLR
jgi:hypothetical protein